MQRQILKFFKYTMIAGLIFGIFFGLGVGGVKLFLTSSLQADEIQETAQEDIGGDRVNILLLGMDARPDEDMTRTDTMILVSIDPELKKVAMVSIPRDTRIDIPGSSMDKICTANMVGGPQLAVRMTEKLLKEDVDYYILMDFKGFAKMVDTLGGVDIEVDQRMYKPSEGIDLRPGLQRLDGHDALAFVRYRDYVTGDIERTDHQQQFLKALANEVMQASTIPKLPGLIKQVNQLVDTDMGITDMLKLARWIPAFNTDPIVSTTLPGYFAEVRGSDGSLLSSYWVADEDQIDTLLDSLMDGEEISVVMEEPPEASLQETSSWNRMADESPSSGYGGYKSYKQEREERSRLPSPGHDDTGGSY
ncbi:MAG TPA: LCP family protein [Syntrophomonadaceae bacterium]|nr:LCP family protein [Syntrophomonadaceae bacterium]